MRELPSYSLYYMFDTDTKTVVQIGTDDTYLYRGTYAGDFSTGVTMTWDHGEWTDEFIYTEGAYMFIIWLCKNEVNNHPKTISTVLPIL